MPTTAFWRCFLPSLAIQLATPRINIVSETTTAPANGNAAAAETNEVTEEITVKSKKAEEPTTSSAIQVAQPHLWGNRPVSPSAIIVHHTMNASGIRPVTSSGIEIFDTMSASGIRPIFASTLHVTGNIGHRPIASNVLEESDSLMGYID